MIRPLVVVKGFEIPYFVVFDADSNDLDRNGDKKGEHKKDNETLLTLLGATQFAPFPLDTVWADRYAVWPNTFGDVVRSEIPADRLSDLESQARISCGHAPGMEKNSVFIGELLRLAFDEGLRPPSLEKLCSLVLRAAGG